MEARRSRQRRLRGVPMQKQRLILPSTAILIFAAIAFGQDSQSLGDAARQARLKKQQQEAAAASDPQAKDAQNNKDAAQAKNAPAKDSSGNAAPPAKPRVITNDEIPSHVGPTSTSPAEYQQQEAYEEPSSAAGKSGAEVWKTQIQAMKNRIASLQNEMTRISESVRFTSANCVANCVQHNERQLQKQQQVETMKAQIDEEQKQLEQMQETARKQGYGSSVYDP